jgi:hypothetical protein
MYEVLREDVAEDEEENSNGLLLYSMNEIEEFRSYVLLTETDECKRLQAMRYKGSIEDLLNRKLTDLITSSTCSPNLTDFLMRKSKYQNGRSNITLK